MEGSDQESSPLKDIELAELSFVSSFGRDNEIDIISGKNLEKALEEGSFLHQSSMPTLPHCISRISVAAIETKRAMKTTLA